MKIMLNLLFILLINLTVNAQLNTIIINIADITIDSAKFYTVNIWKQMPDSTYKFRTKQFYKQTIITLKDGIFLVEIVSDSGFIFNEKIELINETCIAYNLYDKPLELQKADFGALIYVTPGILGLINQRLTYMEF